MWLLTALLAGVLTAGLSSEEEAHRRRKLNEALRQRLGLGPEPGERWSYRRAPVGGGVPVWVWADGDRILRIVTVDQLEEVLDQFDNEENANALTWGVHRAYAGDQYEPEMPGWSIFVYVDAHNRLRALLAVEDGHIVNFSGFGDGGGNISNNTVRSRIFQFIQDYDLTDSLMVDAAWVRILWYDDVLVELGMPELEQSVVHQNSGPLNALKANLTGAQRGWIESYEVAYEDLYVAWKMTMALQDQLVEALGSSADQQEIDDLEEEIRSIGLLKAIKEEVNVLALMLGPSHFLNEYPVREGLHYNVDTESRPDNRRPDWEDSIVETQVIFNRDNRPVWIVGGHRHTTPGMGQALASGGWLETQLELYDKVPEDTIWTWPGEDLPADIEARFLLDEEDFDPVAKELPEFLQTSYRLGLLTPDVIDYWSALLL